MPLLEPLESRIAPASVLLYLDVDGDQVKVTSSSATGDLNGAGVATLVDGFVAGQKQLQKLLLGAAFASTNLTFTVTKAAGGDGFANVGYIDATGIDLGGVTIKGDLGAIDAGDPTQPASAVKTLTVQSLGRFGLATQGGVGDLVSNFDGKLDKLAVKGDVKEAFLNVTDSAGTNGKIGAVFIGGSLIGGAADNTGQLAALHGMGFITIKGDILGDRGQTSGAITSTQGIAGVSIGGSVIGGNGSTSGVIFSSLDSIGPVKIGGSVVGGTGTFTGRVFGKTEIASVMLRGSLIGGTASDSGRIHSDGDIGPVKIGGGIVNGGFASGGGAGAPGQLDAGGDIASVEVRGSVAGLVQSGGDIRAVKIGGDLVGNSFTGPGRVRVDGSLGGISIGGSLIGGGSDGGAIIGGTVGDVKIGRDVLGGFGDRSGGIVSFTTLGNVAIGGSLIGGNASLPTIGSGVIRSETGMGAVKIGGDLRGGPASFSGLIFSIGDLKSLTVRGSIVGTASVTANVFGGADFGPVKIGGDLRGSGANSGGIDTNGDIASVTIGGSVIGGGRGSTGVITADGNLGAVRIGGDLRGGSVPDGQSNVIFSGYIEAARIASVFIGGSILAGFDQSGAGDLIHNASIRAQHDIGPVTIKGSLVGTEAIGGIAAPIISARGQQTLAAGAKIDLAIKSLSIGGDVSLAKILAGFDPDDPDDAGSNGNASIGAVTVGGDWFASSISAGVNAGNFGIGDPDSVINNPPGAATDAIVARIASVVIKGALTGAPNPFFQTGFVAQQVGSFKAAGFTAPLTAGTDPAILLTPYNVNVNLIEMP